MKSIDKFMISTEGHFIATDNSKSKIVEKYKNATAVCLANLKYVEKAIVDITTGVSILEKGVTPASEKSLRIILEHLDDAETAEQDNANRPGISVGEPSNELHGIHRNDAAFKDPAVSSARDIYEKKNALGGEFSNRRITLWRKLSLLSKKLSDIDGKNISSYKSQLKDHIALAESIL